MHSKIKIFSGTSNISLAEKIASGLNLDLSKIEISKFQDGEISVLIKENLNGCHCFLVQSICRPVNDNLIEFLIIIDALRRAHAKKITAVIPYLGYSRQDRKCRLGEPISAKLVAKIISCAGIDDIIIADLHASQIEGFFDIPVSNISNLANFAEDIKKIENFSPEDFVIVAPDVGAAKKTRAFAKILNCNMAIIDKNRSKANCSEVMNIIGNVNNKNAILIDDIIDTAGTISNAAKALVEIGKARKIYIYATHAVCSGKAFEKLSSGFINQVVFSDSIPILNLKNNNIRIISISNILVSEILKFIG
ncbi:MAG: ribose-phosphate diphosphokinase [Clostridia bacterium]|nr:ribose-phosphate diphosphokinase [Clostridia bacterium]